MSEGISAGAVFIDVLPNMAGFSSKIAAGMESQGLASKMSSLGKTLTSRLTLPIVGLAAISTKWAIDFQGNMEMIHTQAGASQGEVNRLSKSVLDLAKSTQQGPQELAKALFHVESVGFRGAQAMKVLKVASEGAAVGGANLEDTASALAAVTLTNIKGTKNYSNAMGVLNATIGAGNMRMSDLLDALKSGIVPTAKVAGLSLSGLTAALAMMTDEGVPAGIAANRLRTALLMMTNPTAKAQTALHSLGLHTLDLGHALQKPDGLVKALTLLQSHLSGVSDKTKRLGLIGDIFGGSRSAGTMAMLLNNLGRVKMKYDQINATASHFNQDVAAQQQTAAAKLAVAWSSVQAALIKVGGTLAPFITSMASAVGSVADGFSTLNSGQARFVLVSLGIVAAIGPTLALLGGMATAFTAVGTGIVRLIGLLPVMETELVAGEGAMVAFGGAMDVALGPIGLVALGIAGVGLAALALVGAFSSSSNSTNQMKDATNQARDAVLGLNKALSGARSANHDLKEARDAQTASMHQVTAAQQAVNKLTKDGKKGTLEYKQAMDNLRSAENQRYDASQRVAAAEQTAKKATEARVKAVNADRSATANLIAKYNDQVKANGKSVTSMGRWGQAVGGNAAAAAKNAADLKAVVTQLNENAKAHLHNAQVQMEKGNPAMAATEKHLAAVDSTAAGLATKLNRMPTFKQIEIQMNITAQEQITQRIDQAISAAHPGIDVGAGIGPTPPSGPKHKKHRATGGPVQAGESYIVGDGVGPELFTPNVDGRISKNLQAGARGDGAYALTITNWEDGTGYIEAVSDGSVRRNARLTRQRRRMTPQ